MSTIDISRSVEVAAPAPVAWQLVSDYSRDAQWRTGVVTMVPSPLGPVAVGTTTVEQIRVAGKLWRSDGEVTAVDEGVAFHWRTTAGAVAEGGRTVTPLDGGRSLVTLQLQATPTGLQRLATPLLRRALTRNLAADADRLAQLVAER